MTEFKQIIGRGTRVRDDYGKLFFSILDYTGSATRQFADPEFDGEPIIDTTQDIDDQGEPTGDDEAEDDDEEDVVTTPAMILLSATAADDSATVAVLLVAAAAAAAARYSLRLLGQYMASSNSCTRPTRNDTNASLGIHHHSHGNKTKGSMNDSEEHGSRLGW